MNKFIGAMDKCVSYLAATAMAGIVILVFVNVFMRYAFNSGLTWSEEAAVNLFVWFIFLGAILAALKGLHLKVDVLTNKLSKKMQKIFSIISSIFVLIAMGVLTIGGMEMVQVTSKNVSSATGLPFSYITISLVVFSVSIIALTLHEIYKTIIGTNVSEEGEPK